MKNSVKKLVSITMILVLMVAFGAVNAGAYEIGDVINYAQPTNIAALINGYQMMSFNVDGFTYIVVEDLRHYGFTVTYNNDTRTLSVEQTGNVSAISPHTTNPRFWEIGSNKTRKNILYTDIVTYVAGQYVTSYNIDGQTIIRFDELSRFGQVSYDNAIREISLNVSGVEHNIIATLVELSRKDELSALAPSLDTNAKTVYGNQAGCEMFIRAKGNLIVYELYLTGVYLSAEQRSTEQYALNDMRASLRNKFEEIKDIIPEFGGIAFIVYDDSGEEVASTTISI